MKMNRCMYVCLHPAGLGCSFAASFRRESAVAGREWRWHCCSVVVPPIAFFFSHKQQTVHGLRELDAIVNPAAGQWGHLKRTKRKVYHYVCVLRGGIDKP